MKHRQPPATQRRSTLLLAIITGLGALWLWHRDMQVHANQLIVLLDLALLAATVTLIVNALVAFLRRPHS